MKKFSSLLIILSLAVSAFAQDDLNKDVTQKIQDAATQVDAADTTYWYHKGIAGANVSQASYTNWSAGGDPSIAFDLMFNFDLNYKKGKHLWTNRLELAFGINNTQSNGLRKTNDKIYFATNYGCAVASHLYIGAMATFNTQFYNGYDYKVTPEPTKDEYISKFMAPGYVTGGLGIIWTPKDWFKLTYAPTSWRGTFVRDARLSAEGNFGVTPGEKLLNQFGSDLVLEVNKQFWEKLTVYSRLELYSNYLKNPQNIIVNWNTMISANITKWLSANVSFNMIYDDNIHFKDVNGNNVGPKLQIKETLGIGLQATF